MAKFYNLTPDYLLGLTETRPLSPISMIDCILNNDAVKVLQNEKYNPLLLSEILTNDNFLCLIVMWKSMLTVMIQVSQIRERNITNMIS